MKSALDLYLDDVAKTPLLDQPEERQLLERIGAGDKEARDQLVTSNLRLVISIAKGMNRHGLALDDAIEEGNCGLCRAADRFQLSHGVKFATYATYWIQAAIRDAIENRSNAIRVPRHAIGLRCSWFKAKLQLQTELKREPSTQEIMDRLGIGQKTAELIRHADRALGITDLEDQEPAVEQQVGDFEQVQASMKTLSPREQEVLKMRFGFEEEEMNGAEIAKRIGTTPQGAWWINHNALQKLKAVLTPESY